MVTILYKHTPMELDGYEIFTILSSIFFAYVSSSNAPANGFLSKSFVT